MHENDMSHATVRSDSSVAPLMMNRRYSLLRARPSSKTTMLATTSVPWI